MKLYFSPGACSLSPHLARRESGLPFELVQVEGYVPALGLTDGEVLTEGGLDRSVRRRSKPGRAPGSAPGGAGFEAEARRPPRVPLQALEDRTFLLGDDFSAANGYAYYALRSFRKLGAPALAGEGLS
jgi:hypothetical protein